MIPLRARLRVRGAAASRRLLVLVAVLAAGCPLRAEDDSVAPGGAERREPEVAEDNVVDLGANFDSNLEHSGGGFVIRPGEAFGDGGLAGGRVGEPPAVARVRAVGAARLAEVERACALSPEQGRKLALAIEADIRRCATEIAAIRSTYAGQTVNLRDRGGQQRWQRFQQDVQRCRRLLAAPFGERSLFAESLSTVLDEGQLATLTAESASRRSFRWRAMVAHGLLRLDDMLALSQRQHDEIERLLIDKEPPLRLDGPGRPRNDHAEQMLVYMMLAEVDQKKLRAAVGDEHWKAALTLANQGRSMRSWIEGEGLIEPKRK